MCCLFLQLVFAGTVGAPAGLIAIALLGVTALSVLGAWTVFASRTIEAKIEFKPQAKVSQRGTDYCVFTALGDGLKRYRLRAFGEVCKRALKELKTQDKVILNLSDIQGEEDDPDLYSAKVDGFRYKDEKAAAKQRAKTGQDSVLTPEYHDMMLNRYNKVWARIGKDQWDWEDKDHVVKAKKGYVSELYFICFVLGTDKVVEICQQEGIGIKENLRHWGRVKQDLLGLAHTDFSQGKWVGE